MKTVVIVFTVFSSFLVCSCLGFNITQILNKHPNFSNINEILTQTGLADEINRRQTITILVVDDAAISDFVNANYYPNMDMELVRNILSVHVILDYYDVEKLTKLGILDEPATLTTLFQASGLATDNRGFVNVSLIGEGEIAFGSAAKGGALSSKLVDTVELHPFNISVLQITAPIRVPGIELTGPPPATAIAAAPEVPVSAPAPKKSRSRRRSTKDPAPAPAPAAEVASTPAKSGGSVAAATVGVGAAVAVLAAAFLVAKI